MEIVYNVLQTLFGVGAGFLIAAPLHKEDRLFGILLIILSLGVGLGFVGFLQ